MIRPAILKMAKTFDQAIFGKSVNPLYSARNAKFDELSDLIDKINNLKDQSSYTRASKSIYKRLRTKSEELIVYLNSKNTELCTALFQLTPKITDDLSYRKDQKEFRDWIANLEDALTMLEI